MKDKHNQLEKQEYMNIDSTILADNDVYQLNDDGYRVDIHRAYDIIEPHFLKYYDETVIQLFDADNNIICKCLTHNNYNELYSGYPLNIALKQGWIYYPDNEKKYIYFMTTDNSLTIDKLMEHKDNSEDLVEYIKNELKTNMKSSIMFVYDRWGKNIYTTTNL